LLDINKSDDYLSKGNNTVVCNWKAYLGVQESIDLASALSKWSRENEHSSDIIVSPSHASLYPVAKLLEGAGISLCAQNIDIEKPGAYTGALSADLLEEIRCKYVMLGHSEIRSGKSLGVPEDDSLISKKFAVCMRGKLNPILCIGETMQERSSGKTLEVLKRQTLVGMGKMPDKIPASKTIYLAYEPVWAISSNKTKETAIPDQINKIVTKLLDAVEKESGTNILSRIKILYGGSVDSRNIASYASQSEIDGVLIGGMSTSISKITAMLKEIEAK
jgi:triosephosphate isomerase